MAFPISFNFDNKIYLMVLNCITIVIIYDFMEDFKINYFNEFTLILTIIVDIVLFFITAHYLKPKINEEIIKEETDIGFIVYDPQKITSSSLDHVNKGKGKTTNIENRGIKEYFIIIIIFFILNIIPFLNNIRIYNGTAIFSFLTNSIFIGIILTNCFTKEKFYNHQILCIIILSIVMFFNPNLMDNYKSYTFYTFIKNCLLSLSFYILQGLSHGLSKYYMQNKFISPFYISIIESAMNLIKNLIIYGYKYYFKNEKIEFNFKLDFFLDYKFYFYSISAIIHPIINILIVYFYSAYHESTCDILGSFFFLFVRAFKKKSQKNAITYIIIGIINIIISFVVCELIILRFCDLDYNTKIEIEKRAIEIEEKISELDSSSEVSHYQ